MGEVHKHKLSDAGASAIAAFLETLDPPRPLPQKDKDRDAITRGKTLFFGKANCKSCHRGPAFNSDEPRAVILDRHQQNGCAGGRGCGSVALSARPAFPRT